jgi:lysozyme
MAQQTKKKTAAIGGGAVAVTAALALSTGIIGKWEGKRNDPYRDIVGVMTVCYGETRVPMRRYTDAECRAMLEKGVREFQEGVLRCTPGLRNHAHQLAAATSLSYNIGIDAYCRSTVARRFNEGNFRAACEGFRAWRFAGGRESRGLINRREDEVKLCLIGL